MKLLIRLLVILIIGSGTACDQINSSRNEAPEPYTFFVAGHTFGIYWMDNMGLHPPFMEKFELIEERNADFGVLLGDIVVESTVKNWDEVDSVLQYLDCKVYFAPGNHDLGDRQLYESRYGKTYFSFIYQQDLFIILDPNIDHWNITGDQLDFLKNVVSKQQSEVINIYVFFHQLIWWDKQTKYGKVRLNSHSDRADTLNFWTEIEPIFHNLTNPVFMFAGDLGGAHWSDDYMYDTYDNITLIASGMGDGEGDNFIIIQVDESGNVSFELVALYGDDIRALGNLEDYVFP